MLKVQSQIALEAKYISRNLQHQKGIKQTNSSYVNCEVTWTVER